MIFLELGLNLTKGSVWKKYIRFVIPIILSGILQQLYNTADTMIAGKFAGDTALAAVGATSSLTNLILNLFLGLAIGTNVICSRIYGSGNKERLSDAIHTSILLALISGVFLATVGFFLSKPLLRLMGTPIDIINLSTLYMRVFFMGAPVSMIYNFGSSVLRAAGDTKRPLYILTISGIANVILNLFCVMVLKLGVLGVAIGTVASQFISAVLVLKILLSTDTEFKLNLKKLRIVKRELKEISAVGIPAGLNGILFSASNVIIQTALNTFGKIAIAGSVAATNIETYGFLILNSAEQGAVSFVGQNMGAKKFDRVILVSKVAMGFAIVGALIYLGTIITFGETLLGLFVDSDSGTEVIKMGMVKLSIAAYSIILLAPNSVLSGVLKGMGKAVLPTMINAIFTCLIRVLWMFIAFPFNPTLNMIFYAYPISWGTSSLAMIVAYFLTKKRILK